MHLSQEDLVISHLGSNNFDSPFLSRKKVDNYYFVTDNQKVAYRVEISPLETTEEIFFEVCGPREKIFFDPKNTVAGIVTCGGLSPGLNSVIRSLVNELHNYGTAKILGIRHGYQGLVNQETPLNLSPQLVSEIHLKGGTILGSSRGPVNLEKAFHFLEEKKVNMLFCVGGDGTQKGALALSQFAKTKKYPLSIIGIPKTIDNDVPFVYQSFGFLTAVEKAKEVIVQAHTEVTSYDRSIAIVKLMGRDAGFITLHACLAAQLADIALIPEVPFTINDSDQCPGLISTVESILDKKSSCLIVVAEGAGQELFAKEESQADLSGNKKLKDIGIRLVHEFKEHFGNGSAVRYFDPSYSIRSVPANVSDSMLCDGLARAAVHAAYAGKTEALIGLWYNNLVHVPISTVCRFKKRVSVNGQTWKRLLSSLT